MSLRDTNRPELASPALVTMRNVHKVYQTGTIALQNVNLDIHEGEFISFVGPSGCGKSTIFRLIAGLGDVSEGEVQVLGNRPDLARQQRGAVSYVFQDATLLPWRSVLENVALPLQLRGTSERECMREAMRVLELVGLQEYRQALPRQLSGGMRMRVSIARALVAKPKLLLMDEPFGALDEFTRQTLQDELLSIWQQEQMTVLFITHNVFESVFLSTRIAVMTPRPGRIQAMIEVPFSYPRDQNFRTQRGFSELVERVSHALHHE